MVVNIASRVAMRGKRAATSGSVYESRRWIAQNEAPAAKGEGSMTYDGKTTSDPTYSTERVTWLAALAAEEGRQMMAALKANESGGITVTFLQSKSIKGIEREVSSFGLIVDKVINASYFMFSVHSINQCEN